MIESLKTGTILYHGSYCEVRQPDLQKCKQYKDFGQGFYLTKDLEQAKNFAKLSTKKAYENSQIKINQNYGIVSCFKTDKAIQQLRFLKSLKYEYRHK